LEALAHEIQFLNYRTRKSLHLIASVDDPKTLFLKMQKILGVEGVKRLFVQALIRSLSIFNQGEANPYYLEKTGYTFEIKLVEKWSDEIYRTQFGKVPVIRDIF